jgi:hypothetical protein
MLAFKSISITTTLTVHKSQKVQSIEYFNFRGYKKSAGVLPFTSQHVQTTDMYVIELRSGSTALMLILSLEVLRVVVG